MQSTSYLYRAHTEPLYKEHNLIKVHDIYYLAVLKFYSKLVNNNLPHYFSSFTQQFSGGQQNYNLRNPTMQLPKIKHEFPKQPLRYKLITTLDITPNETRRAKLGQIQGGGGCRGPSKIRQRGDSNNCLLFTR